MAAATKNNTVTYETALINEFGLAASEKVFNGTFIGDNGSGYARPLVAGDRFLGISQDYVDNSNGSAGDLNIKVRFDCFAVWILSSLAIDDVGKDVYATDDLTLTLTKGSNTRVGYVHRWKETGVGIIHFTDGSLADIAELTDNSGGTAADTIAIIGATYVQSEVANAIASLTAKVNVALASLKS